MVKILALSAMLMILAGCVKEQYVEEPKMTITPSAEDGTIYFSWRRPAVINVHLESDEDIKEFHMYSSPNIFVKDTAFGPYTHNADFQISCAVGKNYAIESKDSTYTLTFKVNNGSFETTDFRKLKYKNTYPKIDSFNIDLSSKPIAQTTGSIGVFGNYFLDIEGDTAYQWSGKNLNYDLVFLKSTDYNIGNSFASPDAMYLKEFFNICGLDYHNTYDTEMQNCRMTDNIGRVVGYDNNWGKVDESVVEDAECASEFLGGLQYNGKGVCNIQRYYTYKCILYNSRKAMLYVDSIDDSSSECKVWLKVKYQTED